MSYLQQHQTSGEIPVGLLYLDDKGTEMHTGARTVKTPLTRVPFEELCPGSAALDRLQQGYR
jgi:2-oxoglutarate ferredoxin oxidoreductase subunit beta